MKKYIIPMLIIAVILMLILTLRNDGRSEVSLDSYNVIAELVEAGYTPAEVTEKPILPDTLENIEEFVDEAVYAEGSWSPDSIITPEDSLNVKVSVIEIDEMKFVRVEIDGKPVHLNNVKWFEEEEDIGNWSAGVETAILRDFDLGLFVSHKIIDVEDVRIGLAGVVDLSQKPEWVAAEIRASIQLWRSIEIGTGIGGMLEQNAIDFHASFGGEIRF